MKSHMFAEGEKGCRGYVGLLMNRLGNQTVKVSDLRQGVVRKLYN